MLKFILHTLWSPSPFKPYTRSGIVYSSAAVAEDTHNNSLLLTSVVVNYTMFWVTKNLEKSLLTAIEVYDASSNTVLYAPQLYSHEWQRHSHRERPIISHKQVVLLLAHLVPYGLLGWEVEGVHLWKLCSQVVVELPELSVTPVHIPLVVQNTDINLRTHENCHYHHNQQHPHVPISPDRWSLKVIVLNQNTVETQCRVIPVNFHQ